jgi:Ser/Thr protein kinase RdoA (MazF antagonist)
MSLLERLPRFHVADAVRLARDVYGISAAASPLPSERDQNFLLATAAGDRYVLKIANGAEHRMMLEAQNAAMDLAAARTGLTSRVLPTASGDTIAIAGDGYLVRLVTYLDGRPLAEAGSRAPALLENVGRAVGRLDAALASFDHPAIHRDFHWDLANAARVIGNHLALVDGADFRRLLEQASTSALVAVEPHLSALRRSAVHHDANDWNVLAIGSTVTGILDFGDMVHSWTVADPAVAIAYAMLDAENAIETAASIVRGYDAEYRLRDDEIAVVFPFAVLRLCMSACLAAWQQRQRPDDEYLSVSQAPIRRTLPVLAAISFSAAERALRRNLH